MDGIAKSLKKLALSSGLVMKADAVLKGFRVQNFLD